MSKKLISFTEGVPRDLLEFATSGHKPAAFDAGSLERDAKVREYMREHNVTDYYAAFRVVLLGADPTEAFAESPHAAGKRRQQATAQAFADVLSGTPKK